MTCVGQALAQSPQRVQASMNAGSASAPGGRCAARGAGWARRKKRRRVSTMRALWVPLPRPDLCVVKRRPRRVDEDAGMKVMGIAGRSGMGKTTLLERLVAEFTRAGRSVSLIKHSHKDIEVDRPGKDSFRLREAGCQEVLLLGATRWALMHELRGDPEPDLGYLLSRIQPCDLVLVEGFKSGDFPKLEVWRGAHGASPLWPDWPGVVAVASDAVLPDCPLPVLALADVAQIANFVWTTAASIDDHRQRAMK